MFGNGLEKWTYWVSRSVIIEKCGSKHKMARECLCVHPDNLMPEVTFDHIPSNKRLNFTWWNMSQYASHAFWTKETSVFHPAATSYTRDVCVRELHLHDHRKQVSQCDSHTGETLDYTHTHTRYWSKTDGGPAENIWTCQLCSSGWNLVNLFYPPTSLCKKKTTLN